MTRKLDVINLGDPEAVARPVMPSACETGGCGGQEPMLPPPPSFGEVRVNGVEITPEAIAEEIQHHPAPDAETAWIEAARALAVRELLLQEASRLGFSADAERDEAGRLEADDDALVRLLLEQEVAPSVASQEECRRYYDANQKRFRTPELFEASHILIEPSGEDAAAWSAAEIQARSIAAEVGDRAESFAEAACAFSSCASAPQDGSLGQLGRGEFVPQVQSSLEGLSEGTTSRAPTSSRFCWYVLPPQRLLSGQTSSFPIFSTNIRVILYVLSW